MRTLWNCFERGFCFIWFAIHNHTHVCTSTIRISMSLMDLCVCSMPASNRNALDRFIFDFMVKSSNCFVPLTFRFFIRHSDFWFCVCLCVRSCFVRSFLNVFLARFQCFTTIRSMATAAKVSFFYDSQFDGTVLFFRFEHRPHAKKVAMNHINGRLFP